MAQRKQVITCHRICSSQTALRYAVQELLAHAARDTMPSCSIDCCCSCVAQLLAISAPNMHRYILSLLQLLSAVRLNDNQKHLSDTALESVCKALFF
jgi:hypothetical protein